MERSLLWARLFINNFWVSKKPMGGRSTHNTLNLERLGRFYGRRVAYTVKMWKSSACRWTTIYSDSSHIAVGWMFALSSSILFSCRLTWSVQWLLCAGSSSRYNNRTFRCEYSNGRLGSVRERSEKEEGWNREVSIKGEKSLKEKHSSPKAIVCALLLVWYHWLLGSVEAATTVRG